MFPQYTATEISYLLVQGYVCDNIKLSLYIYIQIINNIKIISNNLNNGQLTLKARCWCSIIIILFKLNYNPVHIQTTRRTQLVIIT